RCLGFVGLAVPSFLPAVLPAVEVGWRLAREAWGQGLATEGARAALHQAFAELRLRSVISIIEPGNERSIRVAEQLGMRPGGPHTPRPRRGGVAVQEFPAGRGGPRRGPSGPLEPGPNGLDQGGDRSRREGGRGVVRPAALRPRRSSRS